MNSECNFFIEITAPKGLSEIEINLDLCNLPLEALKTDYNGKVILRTKFGEDEDFEWAMDSSDTIY